MTRAQRRFLRRLHLTDTRRMADKLYAGKARAYREQLLATASRHRPTHGRSKVILTDSLRDAIRAEANDHAAKITDTYNSLLDDFAARNDHLPEGLFERRLAVYAAEKARTRAAVAARTETAIARLDAQVGFFRANGLEPTLDFVGPKPECPRCVEIMGRNPYSAEQAVRIGLPHPHCRHRWQARSLAGEMPPADEIVFGAEPAGIIGAEGFYKS